MDEYRWKQLHAHEPHLPSWAVGYVYLLDTDYGWHKVGFTTSPARRVEDYATLPFEIRLRHSFPVAHPAIEKAIHFALRPYQIRSEWYVLPSHLIAIIQEIAEARSGFDLPPELTPDGRDLVSKCILGLWSMRPPRKSKHRGPTGRPRGRPRKNVTQPADAE